MAETAKHETVLDTGALQLGRVYAQALIGAAEKSGATDQVIDELSSIVDEVLTEHPTLSAVFASPRVEQAEKVRILDRLFAGKVHSSLLLFLKVASNRGRLGYLREIRHAADDLRNETLGRVVAEVRTAQPLTDALRTSVKQRLTQSLGKEVVLREKVVPDLIGGLVVRYGDTVIDSSVAGKLQSLSTKAREGFARRLIAAGDTFVSE